MLACCLKGVGLESGPYRVILKTLKRYLLLLCLARDINSKSRGDSLAQFRLLYKVRSIKGFLYEPFIKRMLREYSKLTLLNDRQSDHACVLIMDIEYKWIS